MTLDRLLQQRGDAADIPPLDTWHPALSGDMDIVIHPDGTWQHEGQPFARPAVAKLLASLLRLDDEGYCLVTPAERWRVQVVDRPLLIVEADFYADAWWFKTQFDDVVRLDHQHPLTLTATPDGELAPECAVRFGLAARLHRNVFYRLVEQAQIHELAGGCSECRLYSAGEWYRLGVWDHGVAGEVS